MKKSKYRPFYEKLKAIIKDLREDRQRQAFVIDQTKAEVRKEAAKKRELGVRLDKIEANGRALTMENLMARWHEIKGDTEILWISSPNISIVNAGTMANITDRLRRLCPQLKLIVFTHGDFQSERLSSNDLAEMGLIRIPTEKEWRKDVNLAARFSQFEGQVKIFHATRQGRSD